MPAAPHMPKETKHNMLTAFRASIQYLPFSYPFFEYQKTEFEERIEKIAEKMRRDLAAELYGHLEYLQTLNMIKTHYNNGQSIVRNIVHDALEGVLPKNVIAYKNATPTDYRLFQTADYVCTIELTAIKYSNHE